MGFRQVMESALPAFCASRVAARPLVASLGEALAAAGLLPVSTLMASYDERTQAAVERLVNRLTPDGGERVREIIADSADAAAEGWARLLGGGAVGRHPTDARRAPGGDLVDDAGVEDPESGMAGGGAAGAPGLQRRLMQVLDAEKVDRLSEHLLESHLWSAARRIRELRDPGANHDWLWGLHRAHGNCMPQEEYLAAVRLRVGAHFTEEPVVCGACGKAVMDRCGAHALCCASAESTVGHYKVRDSVHELVALADPSAETEVEGLIPSRPYRRPADFLTSAARPGSLAALDIGVKAPDAVGAGDDCVEAMRRAKMAEYAAELPELEEQGVYYRPLIFSAYGRPHPDATAIMTTIAKRAARRRGVADHGLILRRAQVKVGVQLARRAARMVLACLPQLSASEAALLFGADPAGGAAHAEGDDDAGDGNPAARAGCGLVTAGGTARLGA